MIAPRWADLPLSLQQLDERVRALEGHPKARPWDDEKRERDLLADACMNLLDMDQRVGRAAAMAAAAGVGVLDMDQRVGRAAAMAAAAGVGVLVVGAVVGWIVTRLV
jgi:hypothetical protein